MTTENMKRLIDYIIKEPIHEDKRYGYKFPFNAAEILCSENSFIINKFFEKSERRMTSNTLDFRSDSISEGVDINSVKNFIPELTTKNLKNLMEDNKKVEEYGEEQEKHYVLSELNVFDEREEIDELRQSMCMSNKNEEKYMKVNKYFNKRIVKNFH